VVFIHGLGWDHRSWRPQLTALEDDYEVVAYDYRGHGDTHGSGASVRSIPQLADDLHALVEELGIERPVLCAHSYGGLIAAEYAIQYPDAVSGIVFVDARTALGETTVERVVFRLQPVFDRAADVVGEARVERVLAFLARRVGGMEEGPEEEVPELGMTTSEYAEDAGEAFSSEAQDACMDAGLAYVGASPTDFHVPVLYAYGELTSDVIASKAERLERAPTDVRVEEIEGASHGVMLDRPDAFTETMREFLADVTTEQDVGALDADR
jgi:pimeloyl-ACP methyl ester carboxylesterase